MLYQVLYISSSNGVMDAEELIEILNASRENNRAKNISGMLVYCDGTFMQALEGEKETVTRLFDQIKHDTRHKGLYKFLEGEIPQRNFLRLPMGFRSVNSETLKEITSCSSLLELVTNTNNTEGNHPALIFMKSFVQSQYRQMMRPDEQRKRISPFL